MKIRGIHVRVGEKPEVIEFENTYQEYRRLVDGNIEMVFLDKSTVMFCNEEGKLIGLDGNRMLENGDIIAGDFVIVGDNGGEESISLTDEQIDKYMDRFEEIERYIVVDIEDDYDMEELL
ncbi:DUF3846 domain-containing protein [Clostridiaceae bacterium M8S5]|nr:DUF3846 domain-containing protein [Clostridiaceae bacterium M8S5]